MAIDWPDFNKFDCRKTYDEIKPHSKYTVWALNEHFCEMQKRDRDSDLPENEYIILNAELLSLWFVRKALRSNKNGRIFNYHDPVSGIASQEQIMRFLQALSTSVLYCLHKIRFRDAEREPIFGDVEHDGRFEALNAQIHLLSEYAHIELDIPRELRLAEHLRSLFQTELLLYGTSEGYRDHLFHAIDVCLLGVFLFDCKMGANGKRLSEFLSERPVFRSKSEKSLLANWYVGCLFHDFGYALSLPGSVIGALDKRFVSQELTTFLSRLKETVEKGNAGILNALLGDYGINSKDIPQSEKGVDHGLVSWMEFREVLKLSKRGKKIIQQFEPALKAILRHNKPTKKLSFDEEPISFFMFLCDRLQEWGRPRIDPENFAQSFAAAIRYRGRIELRLNPVARQIYIRKCSEKICEEGFEYSIPCDIPHFLVKYGATGPWTFEPSITWVSNVYDFQSAPCPDIWQGMKITMRTPMSPLLQDIPWQPTEMELLQDYVRQEKGGYLEQLAEIAKQPNKECINYKLEAGKYEEISLRLKLLNQKIDDSGKVITTLPKKLFLDFQQWKRAYLTTHAVLSIWER